MLTSAFKVLIRPIKTINFPASTAPNRLFARALFARW